jgi:hypothetical protein
VRHFDIAFGANRRVNLGGISVQVLGEHSAIPQFNSISLSALDSRFREEVIGDDDAGCAVVRPHTVNQLSNSFDSYCARSPLGLHGDSLIASHENDVCTFVEPADMRDVLVPEDLEEVDKS